MVNPEFSENDVFSRYFSSDEDGEEIFLGMNTGIVEGESANPPNPNLSSRLGHKMRLDEGYDGEDIY